LCPSLAAMLNGDRFSLLRVDVSVVSVGARLQAGSDPDKLGQIWTSWVRSRPRAPSRLERLYRGQMPGGSHILCLSRPLFDDV
jgi:hypothetical protein